MDWKICTADDIQRLSDLNGLLHEDEGAIPMPAAARADRLRKWMDADYTAVLYFDEECLASPLRNPARHRV